jgi:hypothetical protein
MTALNITAAELAQAKAFADAGGLRRFIWTVLLAVLMAGAITGCGKSVPNPVDQTKDPVHIPFGDTVFVIPKKTWLKGYSRHSTDGLVSHISLHALAPNVEPWSPAANDRMYHGFRWGDRIEIDLSDSEYERKVTEKIVSETESCEFTQSPLHNDKNIRFCENEYHKVFGYLKSDYFKYLVVCDQSDPCRAHFAHRNKYSITATFSSRYIKQAFDISSKVESLLLQFDQRMTHIAPQTQGDKP